MLIQHRDEHADPSWHIDSPELDRSALTGRTLKEIEGLRKSALLPLAWLLKIIPIAAAGCRL